MGALALLRLTAAAAACAAVPAAAHHAGAAPSRADTIGLVAALGIAAALYGIGVRRLWSRAGRGRGLPSSRVAVFATGWMVLAVALVSPLDAWAEDFFSAHMVQHELLMVVAAPLLVLGRPLEAWTWGLPAAWRAPVARAVAAPWISRAWSLASDPRGAWSLHAVALWTWHVPLFFTAAMRHPGVHVLQHASFLGTALFFWWSVFGRGTRRPDGSSVANLFTTMLHSGALGALLTFAPTVWYPPYAALEGRVGLSPLEDQQLGGLVMWGPGGIAYLVAGLAIVGLWLQRRPQRAVR